MGRPDRRERRLRGKNDLLDAENAAHAVLSGRAVGAPKNADGVVEQIRQLKVVKETAVKARTTAMITLKALLVTAPPELCEQLQGLSKMTLIDRCAGLCPGPITSPLAAAKHSLIIDHEALLDQLVRDTAPQLVEAFGIGADTAAGVFIVAGDNPERGRSETAWAKLCGVAPSPPPPA